MTIEEDEVEVMTKTFADVIHPVMMKLLNDTTPGTPKHVPLAAMHKALLFESLIIPISVSNIGDMPFTIALLNEISDLIRERCDGFSNKQPSS